MSKEPAMFDGKGTCQYCSKPTRAKATSLCNACYKLDLAIKNNPSAAQKILKQYVNPLNDTNFFPTAYVYSNKEILS